MRQSITRIVLALLFAAVSASLLIGTAFAEGPARADEPSEVAPPPPAEAENTVEIRDVDVAMTTVPSAAGPSSGDVDVTMAAQSSYKCKSIKKTQRGVFWTKTEWCYDGTYIVRGHPVMTEGTKTRHYITAVQSILEKATDPIVWKVSGGLGYKTHHDRGLAHLVICITNHTGDQVMVCQTYNNALSIKKWEFGTGAAHASGSG